jgi:hypothetical protein
MISGRLRPPSLWLSHGAAPDQPIMLLAAPKVAITAAAKIM